jgi:CheY-like chemotaxis protein
MLKREGFEVVTCASGEDAIDTVALRTKPFDLVISDVQMEGMNGFELARQLADWLPRTEVVLMSGCTLDELYRAGFDVDSYRFLPKPFTPADLDRLLVSVARRCAA